MWIKRSEYSKIKTDEYASDMRSKLWQTIAENNSDAYNSLLTSYQKLKSKTGLDIAERDAEIRSLKDKIEGMEVKSLKYQEFYRNESSNNAKKIYSLEEEIKSFKKQSTKKPTKEAEPKLPEDTTVIKITANDKSGNIDVMVESRLQNKAIFCGVLDYAKDAIIKNHLYHKTKPE